VGLFFGVEKTQANLLTGHPDLSQPTLTLLAPTNTKIRGRTTRLLAIYTKVVVIFPTGNFTQIHPPIIVTNTVDVIHLIERGASSHVKISQPVCSIKLLVDYDLPVTFGVNGTSNRTNLNWTTTHTPSECAGLGVVVQQLLQPLLGQTVVGFLALHFIPFRHQTFDICKGWEGAGGDQSGHPPGVLMSRQQFR
jgi:hypothetical protein